METLASGRHFINVVLAIPDNSLGYCRAYIASAQMGHLWQSDDLVARKFLSPCINAGRLGERSVAVVAYAGNLSAMSDLCAAFLCLIMIRIMLNQLDCSLRKFGLAFFGAAHWNDCVASGLSRH